MTGQVEPTRPLVAPGQCFKLIGLGGIGGILARYLALFLASLDIDLRMVCLDGDRFTPENATRMMFSRIGAKSDVIVAELVDQLGGTRVSFESIHEYVRPDNVERLIHEGDIVLLALDNHASRKLIAEHCAGLDNVRLVSGGNDGVGTDSVGRATRGTYGSVQVFVRRAGKDLTPTLWAFHPELADPSDQMPHEVSCTDALQSVPQLLFTNLTAAAATLNTLCLLLDGDALHYCELAFDVAEGKMQPVPVPAPQLGH